MTLTKILRQISWLAVVPAFVMWGIALLLSQDGRPDEVVTFCIKYWWIAFVLGWSAFLLLRSTAWVMRRAGIA